MHENPTGTRWDKLRGLAMGGRGRLRVAAEDRGYLTRCWIWTAPLGDETYGRHLVKGQLTASYRAFYEAKYGPIPDGLHLDHLCSQPACVNPSHLEPVTCTENTRRGRATKLTVEQAREIKAIRPERLRGRGRLSRGEREEVAKRYGVTPDNISAIWSGRSWRDA